MCVFLVSAGLSFVPASLEDAATTMTAIKYPEGMTPPEVRSLCVCVSVVDVIVQSAPAVLCPLHRFNVLHYVSAHWQNVIAFTSEHVCIT